MAFGQNEGDWSEDADEGGEWSTDDGEGLFDEPNTGNPLLTREQDAIMQSPAAKARGAVERSPVALVAQFDESGQPMVARTVMENGQPKQLEEWRRPTPDEYNALMFHAKIVRGGVVGQNVPTATHTDSRMQATPLMGTPMSGTKKALIWGGLGLVVAGAGYGVWRWRQNKK